MKSGIVGSGLVGIGSALDRIVNVILHHGSFAMTVCAHTQMFAGISSV